MNPLGNSILKQITGSLNLYCQKLDMKSDAENDQ